MATEQTSDFFSSGVAYFFFLEKYDLEKYSNLNETLGRCMKEGVSPEHQTEATSLAMRCEGVSYLIPATWPNLRGKEEKERVLLCSDIKSECVQEGRLLKMSESTFPYLLMILWQP